MSMAENNMIAIGTVKTVSPQTDTVLFLAFMLITELLDILILVDVSWKCFRVFSCLPKGCVNFLDGDNTLY
jgi:hypothetical protein